MYPPSACSDICPPILVAEAVVVVVVAAASISGRAPRSPKELLFKRKNTNKATHAEVHGVFEVFEILMFSVLP